MPPTLPPGSHLEIVPELTDRHLIPVVDIDRPDLKHLHIAPGDIAGSGSTATLYGAVPPSAVIPAVAAGLVHNSVAANSDLTFAAVEAGAEPNGWTIEVEQQTGLNAALGVGAAAGIIIISLPTDGAGAPVAATATQVKMLWDASPVVDIVTVTVEGTGAGAVDVLAPTNLTGGEDEIPATGTGTAGPGTLYVDHGTPGLYINTGTAEAPVWEAV
jgi:hypothetical protein